MLNKRKVLGVASTILCCAIVTKGQNFELPKIIPPSPAVKAMQKFSDVPISYYTGTTNITVPIHEIQLANFSLPINLMYHSATVHVQEESGRVGLGWALNAGGQISRNIYSYDDFDSNRYLDIGKPELVGYPLLYQDTVPLAKFNPSNIQLYPYVSGDGVVNGKNFFDFQPDKFTLQLPGYSNKFIISSKSSVILENEDQTLVEFTRSGDRNATVSWKVTTQDGNKYYFTSEEMQSMYVGAIPPAATAWFLDKIETIDRDTILFMYDSQVGSSYNVTGATELNQINFYTPGYPVTNRQVSSYYQYSKKLLKNIIYPNGKIEFLYSARADIYGESKLDTVKIFNGRNQLIKNVNLEYDYFIPNVTGNNMNLGYDPSLYFPYTTDNTNRRLKLKSVLTKDAAQTISDERYSFEYNETYVPNKISTGQDHWGYFNGVLNNPCLVPRLIVGYPLIGEVNPYIVTTEGADRSPNATYAGVFLLKKLTYPTGGTETFEYESNDYDYNKSVANDSRATRYYNSFYKRISDFNTPADFYAPIKIYSISVTQSDQISGKATARFDLRVRRAEKFITGMTPSTITLKNSSGVIVKTFSFDEFADLDLLNTDIYQKLIFSADLTVGNYTVEVVLKDNQARNIDQLFLDVSWSLLRPAGGLTYESGAGVRISKIIQSDNFNNTKETKLVYGYTDPATGIKYSYGKLLARPRYFDYNPYPGQSLGTNDIFLTSNPVLPEVSVAYDKVTEYVISQQGDSIRKDYEFINEPYPVFNYSPLLFLKRPVQVSINGTLRAWEQGFDVWPGACAFISNPFNGKLIRETAYAKNAFNSPFRKVTETRSEYEDKNLNSLIWAIDLKAICALGDPSYPEKGGMHLNYYPAIRRNWVTLNKTIETSYEEDTSRSITVQTDYSYKNVIHKLLTDKRMTLSNLKVASEHYQYPQDIVNPSTAMQKLITQRRLSTIVSQSETIDSANKITKTYDFLEFSNGIVNPAEIFFKVGNGAAFSKGKFLEYNTRGRVLTTLSDGIQTAFIWGYNSQYPVAKVVGKAYSDIKGLVNQSVLDAPADDQQLRTALNSLRIALAGQKVLITTYTYNPGLGITSETDQNSRTTYYEYDGLGRLKVIRDHDGNVLKQIDYQYQAPLTK
ncbi:RHS repeat domain-containing protein [Chitinophaga ginsengisoli]|uniref:YD repeat-containing protein n=1 Tax=Chitinophaga ginsengisoli TaxID=363837 RepID=A0A2P8FXM8_9BACT|nr:RHS repeat domain-containing protein [Chitinophaga ginsengisoli]PSL26461.1 YD repeat-containing protein [Chitinophaga ginsengisoli]